MRRGGSRLGSLLLFVLSGIIIGSIAGHILASFLTMIFLHSATHWEHKVPPPLLI